MDAVTATVLLLELAWKSTLIFGGALLICAALPARASAAERHLLVAAAMLAALALPAVALLGPSLRVPLPEALDSVASWQDGERALVTDAGTNTARSVAGTARLSAASAGGTTIAAAPYQVGAAVIAWAGLLTAAGLLGLMFHHVRRVGRSVRSLGPAPAAWQAVVDRVRGELGVRREVRALHDAASRSPWMWGVLEPVIVLPAEFAAWTGEARRAAVLHELAHVRRHDQLTLAAAGACVALYWWQPLAWLALRRLRQEAEQACDDHVLLHGAHGGRYAAQLLELAKALQAAGRHSPVALAMARPSGVALRLRSILNPNLRRTVMDNRRLVLASIAAAAVLAGLGPIAFVGAQERPVPAGRLDDPAFQRLAASGPANDVELGTLVATYVANDRDALAVQTLVDYIARQDVSTCDFCSDVLRPGRPLFASAPVLATFVAPAWSGLRAALDAAFEELEQRAYDGNDGRLLVKIANIHVGSRDQGATQKAAWYLLEGLRLGNGADADPVKAMAMEVLYRMGRLADAELIARELHDEPASQFYQSEVMKRWIRSFETEGRQLDALSARLRGVTPIQGEDYLPLSKTAPRYPQDAAQMGLEGHVIIEFTVAVNGRPRDVTVVQSSNPLFEEAALEAARGFLYMPRYEGGVPVEVPGVRNKITFVLDRG